MLRAISVVSLCLLLSLVLYLPAAYTPAQFTQHVRTEHTACGRYWDRPVALRIMARALLLMENKPTHTPMMIADRSAAHPPGTVAREVAHVGARLFNNAYIHSLNGLFALSTYRLATLIEWLPPFGILLAASAIDGMIRRAVKRKEFLRHSPEIYGLCAGLVIVMACALVLLLVAPWSLHPMVLPLVLLCFCVCVNLGIANYAKA